MENKLEVWKKAHQLTLKVYALTKQFPSSEQFGLTIQLKRSAGSIPSNIIEGQSRQHKKEFIQFLYISKGSLSETEYHLFLAKDLKFITEDQYQDISTDIISIRMMLNKLISSLK